MHLDVLALDKCMRPPTGTTPRTQALPQNGALEYWQSCQSSLGASTHEARPC